MTPDEIESLARALVDSCRARSLTVATAESCTGGLIAGAITAVPGSSAVLDRGFVTYSNAAKTAMLGVPEPLLEAHGAVSRQVALAMVEGALAAAPVDLAVAVTGIAGPDGGTDTKPVGLVHIAAARRSRAFVGLERRYGAIGRAQVREATVRDALAALRDLSLI